MQNSIILENIDSAGLKEIISEAVRCEIGKLPAYREKKYLTRIEVCDLLHVSLPTIDKAIKTGKLKAYRINGRILFKENEIDLTAIPTRKHV